MEYLTLLPHEISVVEAALKGKNKTLWYQASYDKEGALESLKPLKARVGYQPTSSESLATGHLWLHRVKRSLQADTEAKIADAIRVF